MGKRRLGDRLDGLTLLMFNPLLWLIDVTLQKRWPLTDPRPPRGIGLRPRVLWEACQFTKDLAIVLTGLAVVAAIGFVVILLVVGLIGALGTLPLG